MIIKKKQQVIELEAILEKVNYLTETFNKNLPENSAGLEVTLQYISNGVLLHEAKTNRYVRCAVLPDYEGICLELGVAGGDDKQIVMSILKNNETEKAGGHIWTWLVVNSGYVLTVEANGLLPKHSVARSNNQITRSAFKEN